MPTSTTYEEYLRDAGVRSRLSVLWYHFEFVGTLVERGDLSEDLVFDQQGTLVAGIWDKTEALIRERRRRQGEQYMENFELLRHRFDAWATKHPPKLNPGNVRRTDVYYGRPDATRESRGP